MRQEWIENRPKKTKRFLHALKLEAFDESHNIKSHHFELSFNGSFIFFPQHYLQHSISYFTNESKFTL